MEQRTFNLNSCEVRKAGIDNPRYFFSGHAAVFNSLSQDLGGFVEKIAPGAFTRALQAKEDVRFLINHDANLLLARSGSGTLTLTQDERGLKVEAELPKTSYAQDLAVLMDRGDISQMSFGFRVQKDTWEQRDGQTIRTLEDVSLVDVSAVTFPAYLGTDASVDVEARKLASMLAEVRAGKMLSGNSRESIQTAIDTLQALLMEADTSTPNPLNPRSLRLALRERAI